MGKINNFLNKQIGKKLEPLVARTLVASYIVFLEYTSNPNIELEDYSEMVKKVLADGTDLTKMEEMANAEVIE